MTLLSLPFSDERVTLIENARIGVANTTTI